MAAVALVRRHLPATFAAGIGVAVIGWLSLYGFAWNDYDDEASQAYLALVHGHVVRFLQLCPSYGGALELRAPFALLPGLWGGGELAVYRFVSVPCIVVAALLAVWLVGRLRGMGVGRLARAVALGLIICGPLNMRALELGHAEELMVSAFCVAAVLAALARRPWWAAVLLGLAVGAKPWAILAAGPVLAALPAHRVRTSVVAAVVAASLLLPFTLAAHGSVQAGSTSLTTAGTIFQPWQVWWFLGDPHAVVRGTDGIKPHWRGAPAWIANVSHPLVVVLGLALTLLWLRRRRERRRPGDELLLLALVLQARCLLDTWDTVYYAVPCVFALVAWETLVARRAPLLGLLLTVAGWVSFNTVPNHLLPDPAAAIYLAWALPFTAFLALRLYAPGREWSGARAPGTGAPHSNRRPDRGRRLPRRRLLVDQ